MIKNILANVIGRFWTIFSTFIFIPFYINILGFESYSIISFTLIISGLLAILDSGLTATLSREFARNDISKEEKVETFITFESVYFVVISVAIVTVFSLSKTIAYNWLKLSTISSDSAKLYFKIISIDIGFQLLMRFYIGGFIGLEKQVKANIFQVLWAICRSGLVIFLIRIKPSLELFFIWQAVSSILATIIIGILLKVELNQKIKFQFKIDFDVLKKNWRFAFGMLLIALVAGLNTQIDKLIISKVLPVESLGYYTLAVSMAMGIIAIVSPISTSLLPRFTSLFSENKNAEACSLFLKVNLMVSIIVFAIMSNMIFFSKTLIWIWTGDLELSKKVAIFLPYMAFSIAMLAIATTTYNIAIANGYTKLNNILGIISLIITLPGYWLGTQKYGPLGAAIVYSIVQFLITTVYIYFIREKFLKNIGIATLFLHHLILPISLSLLATFLFSLIPIDLQSNRSYTFIWCSLGGFFTILIVSILLIRRVTFVEFFFNRVTLFR